MSSDSAITMKVDGFAELEAVLDDLPKATGKNVLRRGLKSAAEPMAELANSLAPVGETGDYAQSFAYSTKLSKRQGRMHRKMFRDDRAAVEGFVGTDDPAGVQQEFGNIHHAPQAALRPAWDQDHKAMLDRLGKDLWEQLAKALARAERKAARLAAKG